MRVGIRQKLGAIGLDWPRFEWWVHRAWILIRNRSEILEPAPDGSGIRCCWDWTSDLHIAKVFPLTGGRLLERALGDWPIRFADALPSAAADPQVSFVIGHRGTERLPHLLATLRTIVAQRQVACECIVVEQSDEPEVKRSLPPWVRYVHTRPPERGMPYCRSWTLNVGARMARGSLLVLHDNDMLVPEEYAAELWRRFADGYEVINLKRFVFYFDKAETRRFFESGMLSPRTRSEAVVQNLEAGGSVAVGREAYLALGGFDESFVGWGGEDNEFWERAQTRRVWPYAYLPIVHLWHPAQLEKFSKRPITEQFLCRTSISVDQRIADLVGRNFGNPDSPDPAYSRGRW